MIDMGGNFFNKHKSKNPLIKFAVNYFYNKLEGILRHLQIQTLLDAGCGEGEITKRLHKQFNFKITAIDNDKILMKEAGIKNPGIKFMYGNIYNLNLKKDSFDMALCTEVLEHLEYPDKAIEDLKRVSRRYCIFSVPNEPLWRIANMARLKYIKELGNSPGHINHWTKRSFYFLLNKHFKKVRIINALIWNIALCEK
jgi:2-polyprenyl-3-methyl-5-hydroxy-6-metoxy-1,4-benzoquinol methylase